MEQHVFTFSLISEGATEKALQLIMPLKSIYNQNLGFIEQKMDFRTLQRGSNNKNLLIENISSRKYFSVDLYRAAPYRLMLVFHKDALFHLIQKQNPQTFQLFTINIKTEIIYGKY
jgi:hypothetical protein